MMLVIALSLYIVAWSFLGACARCRISPLYGLAAFVALYAGVLVTFVIKLQFTATPAFAATAALCLLQATDGATDKRKRVARLTLVGLLMLYALALRAESCLMTLPLFVWLGIARLIRRASGGRWLTGVVIVLSALVCLGYAGDLALYNASDEGWAASQPYIYQRSELMDFSDTTALASVAPAVTDWSPELTACVRDWFFLDERITTEALAAVNAGLRATEAATTPFSVARATASILRRYGMFRWNLLPFALAVVFALIACPREKRLRGALALAGWPLYLLAIIAFFYGILSRFPTRVAFVAACPVYVMTLLSVAPMLNEGDGRIQTKTGRRSRRALALLCALALGCSAATLYESRDEMLCLRWQPGARQNGMAMTEAVNAYAVAHPDTVFVTELAQCASPLRGYQDGLPVNLMDMTTGYLRTPLYQEKLTRLGYSAFSTRDLWDERARLIICDESRLQGLLAYIRADYGDVACIPERREPWFTVYRLVMPE